MPSLFGPKQLIKALGFWGDGKMCGVLRLHNAEIRARTLLKGKGLQLCLLGYGDYGVTLFPV